MKRQIAILFLIISLASCDKPEGEGGNATIRGKVWAQKWNSTFTVLEAEYPAMDEDIYIIYGNSTSYGERIRTSYEGNYEFRYLREGSYRIYIYSKDSTLQSPAGKIAVVKDIKITSDDQVIDVDQITIFK
jgi:hypothetical protein